MVYPEEHTSAPRLGKKNSLRGRAGRSAPPRHMRGPTRKIYRAGAALDQPMKPSMNGNQLPCLMCYTGDQASGRMTASQPHAATNVSLGSNLVARAPSPARTTCSAASPPRDRRGINRIRLASRDIGVDVLQRHQLHGVPELGNLTPLIIPTAARLTAATKH